MHHRGRKSVSVRELLGDERDRVYAEQARRYPGFAEYERQIDLFEDRQERREPLRWPEPGLLARDGVVTQLHELCLRTAGSEQEHQVRR